VRPKGTVAAFLTYDADHVLITVPGYALSTALSNSLKIDEQKFSSIAAARYEAGVTTLKKGFEHGERAAGREADEPGGPQGQPLRLTAS
jgi:hypothetical protein